MRKRQLKLFHFDNFALTMTVLPRKLVPQIFWFPKYTLYLHRELIFVIDRIGWVSTYDHIYMITFIYVSII